MILRHTRLILCVGLAVVALPGCGGDGVRITERERTTEEGSPLRAISALNCPDHHGSLTRVETSTDGLSCGYSGPRGGRVTLQLLSLPAGQSPEEVLAPFEAEAQTLMPDTPARASAGNDGAAVSVQSDGENARVRLPGVSIDQGGERASIEIGGIRIRTDAPSEPTDGNVVSVSANEGAAEVRTRGRGGEVRATYILTDEVASDEGWRTVGYEARGPGAGPIVVAIFRSKGGDEDTTADAARELVTLNVGGLP